MFQTIDNVIEFCNGNIQDVATCYYMAVNLNRKLTFIIIILAIIVIKQATAQHRISPINRRKLKYICKLEKRPLKYQIKHAIEMFIDAYGE